MPKERKLYNHRRRPYEFNRKAYFGKVYSVQSESTGAYKRELVPTMSLYYAPMKRGLTLESELTGTKYENTITIVVRHNSKLNDNMVVQFDDDEMYNIVEIQSDDSNKYLAYDFVILKLNKGVRR